MKKKIAVILIITLLIIITNSSDIYPAKGKKIQKLKIKNLDTRYRDWWTLVTYIITPVEKETFLSLKNNRERDSFINLFWKIRDPSKGTPQNEFKEEHIKRVAYANQYFKYGTPLPGWKTDKGRVYILLGPPLSKNEISHSNLTPVEIWEYFGSPAKGLPTVFRIVFYRPSGLDDYKLYVPAINGPAALLKTGISSFDPADYRQIYEKIYELEPAVAEIALTLIPGDKTYNYRPSLQGPLLISKIYDLPKKKINTNYARDFLKYKGLVDTSFTTDYINIKSDIYILKDPILNMNFIHFALFPERISVDFSPERGEYYFNFDLMIILKKGDNTIYKYSKKFPYYCSQQELNQRLSHGIIIADYLPIIEGEYQLTAILQNSINNEIGYYERNLKIGSPNSDKPQIYGPLLSYQISPSSQSGFSSFTILGNSMKIDPKTIFGLRENIYVIFYVDKGNQEEINVDLEVLCLDEKRPYSKKYQLPVTSEKNFHTFSQLLEKLNYGNYQVIIKVTGKDDSVYDYREKAFMVSPSSAIIHPPIASKILNNQNKFLFFMILAKQYQQIEDFTKSELYFQRAYILNKQFPTLIKSYGAFLLNQKKFTEALQVIENLKDNEKETFSYFSLKGRTLYYQGEYTQAVDFLLKANKINDSDVIILNTLGLAFIKLDNIEEAKKAFAGSLLVNKNQKTITKILSELEKK